MSESPGGSCAGARVEAHPVLGGPAVARWVRFALDGRELEAREGEALAAALLANGVRVFRTMPGADEPRGPFCAVGRCPDCALIVDGLPNVRACQTPVREGMRVERQRGLGRWGAAR